MKRHFVRLFFAGIVLFSAFSISMLAPTMVAEAQTGGAVSYGTHNGITGIIINFVNPSYTHFEIRNAQGNVVQSSTTFPDSSSKKRTVVLTDSLPSGKYSVSVYNGLDASEGKLLFTSCVIVP